MSLTIFPLLYDWISREASSPQSLPIILAPAWHIITCGQTLFTGCNSIWKTWPSAKRTNKNKAPFTRPCHPELRTMCSAIFSYLVLLSVKSTATQKYYMENYRRKQFTTLNCVLLMQFNNILYSFALFKTQITPLPSISHCVWMHPSAISSEFSFQTACPVPWSSQRGLVVSSIPGIHLMSQTSRQHTRR